MNTVEEEAEMPRKYIIEDDGEILTTRTRRRYVREALEEHKIRHGSKVEVAAIKDEEELGQLESKQPFTEGFVVEGKSFTILIFFNGRERTTLIEWVVESDHYENEDAVV